jgi:putative hydrolase of the HAD superfamily
MPRAVLFDLDDTLFDHAGCARCALEAVHRGHDAWARTAFEDFARAHARILEVLHQDVLAGRRTIDDAREARFRQLLVEAGAADDQAVARAAAARYRAEYIATRRAVAGAAALLAHVRARLAVGIVTNNLRDEQVEKLRSCGLEAHVDVLVASEEVGIAKPDPAIFEIAVERLGCGVEDVVMVGDSWEADVLGARAAGIAPLWFNPAGRPAPDPGVPVLRALAPADEVFAAILDAHRH